MVAEPLIKTNQLEEIIADFDRSSFQYEWANNETRQISFTVYRTVNNADIFDLLQIGVSVVYDGQEYVIQQCKPLSTGKVITKEITATHVMFECQTAVYQYNTKGTDDNPVSLTPDDIMDWIFGQGHNDGGFTWEIQGTFAAQSLSGITGSGKDALDKIADTWPCYIMADNKKIIIADADHFKKSTEKQLRYLYNTDETSVQMDRSTITNAMMCYPKQNEDGSYVFDQFLYRNEDSIAKWGIHYGSPVSDERFTDKDHMTIYAATQAHPDPDVELSTTYQGDEDVAEGEVWLFIAPLLGFDSDVTVLGLMTHPYDKSQKPTVTLSNTLKDIYKIQREIASAAKKAQTSAGSALKLSGDAKTAVDALDQVAVRIGSDTEAQSAKLSAMATEADTTPILPVLKPDGSIFYPETDASAVKNLPASLVTSVAGKTGAVTLDKSDVGLDNVDNTADVDKPISTPQAEEIAKKQDKILVSANGNQFTLRVADDGTLSTIPYDEGGTA